MNSKDSTPRPRLLTLAWILALALAPTLLLGINPPLTIWQATNVYDLSSAIEPGTFSIPQKAIPLGGNLNYQITNGYDYDKQKWIELSCDPAGNWVATGNFEWRTINDTINSSLSTPVQQITSSAGTKSLHAIWDDSPLADDSSISSTPQTIHVVEVASLEPSGGEQIDDGDGDSDTNTYVMAVNDGQSLTITATPNPGLPANELPSGWDLKGGVGTDKLTRTIDLSKAETHTLKATCGTSSKTTTIHVVKVESVTADKEAIFVGKEVLFTAALKPISAPVELLKWEWRQKNDDGSWADWSSLFGGGLTKIIMQILPKDYQVNGSATNCL